MNKYKKHIVLVLAILMSASAIVPVVMNFMK